MGGRASININHELSAMDTSFKYWYIVDDTRIREGALVCNTGVLQSKALEIGQGVQSCSPSKHRR